MRMLNSASRDGRSGIFGLCIGCSRATSRTSLLSVVLAVAGASLTLLASGPTLAQSQYTFSERNQKTMIKVMDAVQEGNVEEAKNLLESINLRRARPYGRARVHQMLGTFAAQEEQYEPALEHLKASLAEESLPPEDQLRVLFLVGQLQTMLERYDEAVATLESWISQVEDPAPSSYYTLAVAYYQAGRLEDAVAPAAKAIEIADEPKEAWYRLLLSLRLTREEYQEALALLDDMILKFPSRVYWQQMAAIYSELGKLGKSLAVQQLAKMEGFITEDRDLMRLAQMLMMEGLPHRGAEVLEEGLKNGSIEPTQQVYQTYSDTLLQSREWAKAIEPLSKAAELDDGGSLYLRLAQVNLQLGRWRGARDALDKAFERGGLPDEGQAHILYGIAAANDKQWDTAVRAFQNAERFEGTADTASKWIQYVEREKQRLSGG